MNPDKSKRVAVRFTQEADLSSLPPRSGFRDPEGEKTPERRAIEEATAAQHADEDDRDTWPKARDAVPDPAGAFEAMGDGSLWLSFPDSEGDPSEPNPGFAWEPGREIPVLSGTPSADQTWELSFCRAGRHMRISGTDNTFASKVSRMIRAEPLRENREGSEGWGFCGADACGFQAFGPKAALSLRGGCAGHGPIEKAASAWFLEEARKAMRDGSASAPMKGMASDGQWTTVVGSRLSDWCLIETSDNTFATRIGKAAEGHPGEWAVRRAGPRLVEAVCPKGCLSFRRVRR